MEFFAQNEHIERLDAALAASQAVASVGYLSRLVELAWQLRQRDMARALTLNQQAQALLLHSDLEPVQHMQLSLRLALVQGEAKWLMADLKSAAVLAKQCLAGFTALDDPIGCFDAHWLQNWVGFDQGDIPQAKVELTALLAVLGNTDPVRQLIGQAALARLKMFDDRSENAPVRDYFAQQNTHTSPASACWVQDLLGAIASAADDYPLAIGYRSAAWGLALESGQIRRAIIIATNIGASFSNLHDYQAALGWMERSQQLARSSGWPTAIGETLLQSATVLRQLQRHDNAWQLLREALVLLEPKAASRSYALALQYLGDVELERGQYASALDVYQLLEERAVALRQSDLLCESRRGQAAALSHLGQPLAALKAAHSVLAEPGALVIHRIETLRVLAGIHARHVLPLSETSKLPVMEAGSAPLFYLQQALSLAKALDGYATPGGLYQSIASEYAKLGDHASAYEFALKTMAARERTHDRETNSRAIAMQINHQTERSRTESEHHRQLAAAEAKRAGVLQQTNDTLELLGTIGQEITAHLEMARIFAVLTRHVHHLLDVNSFGIFLMKPEQGLLELELGLENGQPITGTRIALDTAGSMVAQCARENREIFVDYRSGQADKMFIPGSLTTRSSLFAPLCLAEQMQGVMTIQSLQPHAYGTRERLIFRTLCAYTAIALANARSHHALTEAHRNLQQTQQQMLLQGKMAGLGTLTAGVAHEINNPTNFAHVAAQNLKVDVAEFREFTRKLIHADAAPAMLDAFMQRFAKLSSHIGIMQDGTARIKHIVKDLRAFTRPEANEKSSVHLSECLLSTLNLVRTRWQEHIRFDTEWIDDPLIECWPALLNQVFMNLLINGAQAITAKFGSPDGARPEGTPPDGAPLGHVPPGLLTIRMQCQAVQLRIAFRDNGIGMDQALQARILEPFFTTKTVGEGTGLGLAITWGIIDKHGGALHIESQAGEGSCFTVCLPL
jgi:signal transduction histidine kinase/tetratricopeptide (TPR) repeat protein